MSELAKEKKGGGGAKVASGSFTLSGQNNSKAITGLGFRPAAVFICATSAIGNWPQKALNAGFFTDSVQYFYYSNQGNTQFVFSNSASQMVCTMSDDGFTISGVATYFCLYTGTYNWVALEAFG